MFHQIGMYFTKLECISWNQNVFHQIIMLILYSVVFVISHKNDIIQTGWWCFYYNWKLYPVGTQAEIKCMFNLLINFIICSSLNIQSCWHTYFIIISKSNFSQLQPEKKLKLVRKLKINILFSVQRFTNARWLCSNYFHILMIKLSPLIHIWNILSSNQPHLII